MAAMPAPQTYKNHTRYDPLFHFTIIPLALIAFFGAIHLTVHDWPRQHGAHILWILLSFTSILIAGMARSSALRAQDRVIRLEERLRYAALLSPAEAAAAEALTLRQIIALRFASDAELPALIKRTLAENLPPKQIKESIVTWRPDNDRV
jgi:hypothetical protein